MKSIELNQTIGILNFQTYNVLNSSPNYEK